MRWNKKVPYKIKRTLFRGAVCGASLTGLTALLLHERDYLRLQRCLEKKLRALMLGAASWEGPDHIRTLSSRQVWKRWRLAPPAYELCVQRLRWYQSIAREPARHAHLLCCWFGRMHFESHDTLIEGLRLHPEANGYAKRLLADLQTLAFVPEWAEQVANVEMEFGDVFRLGSKLNEWFLSLDLERLSSRRQWHLVESSSVMMKGTTIWKGRMKTTFAHCLMRMDGNVVNVGRRHERSLHINVTHRENAWRTKGRVASLVVTNQCFWCGSTHASIETTSKHMAAAERHNRCVVDAGRFHYLVIDIPPDTICPRCDLIFNDTAELQRHLASMEYPPPEGHSLVINAETLCRCLWKRSLAKDPRQMESKTGRKGDENTSNRNLEGRRTTWRWGARAWGRRDLPRAPTRARTRSYTTPSSRRSACSLSK